MGAAKQVTVTVKPGNVVYIDGTSYGPGATFTVAAAEAAQLEKDGRVQR